MVEAGIVPRAQHISVPTVLSPDGRTLACVLNEGVDVVLFETSTGRVRQRFHDPAMAWTPFAFSPDGTMLAATTEGPNPTVLLWDVSTGKKLHEWAGHRGRITRLAFTPDGSLISSGSMDCTVLIWDLKSPAK